MSSLTYNKTLLPFELQSSLYGIQNLSIKNWPTGKISSIFVSEIVSTSTLHLICSESNPNLFRIEFMLKWAKISSLKRSSLSLKSKSSAEGLKRLAECLKRLTECLKISATCLYCSATHAVSISHGILHILFIIYFFASGYLLCQACLWLLLSLRAGWLACALHGNFVSRCWFLQLEMLLLWHSLAPLRRWYWAGPWVWCTPYMNTATVLTFYIQV